MLRVGDRVRVEGVGFGAIEAFFDQRYRHDAYVRMEHDGSLVIAEVTRCFLQPVAVPAVGSLGRDTRDIDEGADLPRPWPAAGVMSPDPLIRHAATVATAEACVTYDGASESARTIAALAEALRTEQRRTSLARDALENLRAILAGGGRSSEAHE
jgi:hypothetical protein